MCGATGTQSALSQEQMSAYQEAQQLSAEQYSHQQAIFKPMADQFQSIFKLGPSQEGFSDQEENTLNAQAVAGTAANYSQAAKAVSEGLAAEGGGNDFIGTGGAAQMKEEVAQSAAQSESQQLTQIKEADYNQGYQQWLQAAQGLSTIATGENPLGYQSGATSAGGAAGETANQIATQQNSWINAAMGAAGAMGTGIIEANPHNVFG